MYRLLGHLAPLCILAALSATHALAGDRQDVRAMSIKAQSLLRADPVILAAKSRFSNLILKHPSFVDHANYQTLRYHLVWVESRTAGPREWEIYGGGADVHYVPGRDTWSLNTRIPLWNTPVDLSGLLDERTLGEALARGLKLIPGSRLSATDFELHRKLLIEGERVTPVYWVRVLARALLGTYHSARIVVINARTGKTLANYSTRHHSEAIPPIAVRTGSLHIVKSKLNDDQSATPAFTEKFKDSCQVISTNKKSRGDPLLITPAKCDLVLETDKTLPRADESANRAFENSTRILGYYVTEHNQYGFDNDRKVSKPIVSITHIGEHYDNAYWDADLEVMAYGDGQGDGKPGSTHDYTLALDIAGHEFTHAIVSHTANLATPAEPGALNEAFADIFGILISRSVNKFANWNIGAKLYDNKDGDSDEVALRSLSDPTRYKSSTTVAGKDVELPFPKKYSDRFAQGVSVCNDDNDQCEVHANSTIWSHNAFLTESRLQELGYDSMTADRMTGQIFFAALTHRLHENTSMKEAATETLAACADLFTPKDCAAVREAFVKTELVNP